MNFAIRLIFYGAIGYLTHELPTWRAIMIVACAMIVELLGRMDTIWLNQRRKQQP